MLRVLRVALWSFVAILVVIQLVPYGRRHSNPPHHVEPKWDKPETRALARRACFDCHSNETVWPWYSHVAPMSWLVQHDVDEARHEMNFSEWDRPQDGADHAAKMVSRGKMPLRQYLLMHPQARLTPAARDSLEIGLTLTIGADRGRGAHESVEDDFGN